MRHSHTRTVRLGSLRLPPAAHVTRRRRRRARPRAAPYRPYVHTGFQRVLDHPDDGARHDYEGAADLLADADTVRRVLGFGGHWRFLAHGRGASIALESRTYELIDQRAALQIAGPTPQWADETAAAMREALSPHTSGAIRALARTAPAMLVFTVLPFAAVFALTRAGHTELTTLLWLPLLAAVPFLARATLGLKAQGAARLDLEEPAAKRERRPPREPSAAPVFRRPWRPY